MSDRYLSPVAVAKKLGVKDAKIRQWIEEGKLTAVNLGNGDKCPRWKISPDALDEFLRSRSNQAAKRDPVRRRRRPADEGVTQYF